MISTDIVATTLLLKQAHVDICFLILNACDFIIIIIDNIHKDSFQEFI